ncbi:hypothetical protein BJX96DRAFT_141229 [Aspergillus floccosus]
MAAGSLLTVGSGSYRSAAIAMAHPREYEGAGNPHVPCCRCHRGRTNATIRGPRRATLPADL